MDDQVEPQTQPPLRVVGPDERMTPEQVREAYWAQVQALRADLHRLRPVG